jgi:S1-C subfamily serine protease
MQPQQPDPIPAYDPYHGWPPPPPPAHRKSRRGVAVVAALATVGAVAAGATVVAVSSGGSVAGSGTALARVPNVDRLPQNGYPGYGFPNDGSGGSGGSSGGSTGSGTATSAQSRGVVDINTVLGYQQAAAAGTGMIVTSSGEVLTNNHVVDGATQITVTVVSTGKTYSASVVGTDATDDVAVLQLSGASGLQTASFGDSSSVTVGEAVTGVGNAGGAGGTPSAASGHVTALDQQLTATDDSGGNAETLTGMIESDAPIAAGDSGGPLYDTSGKIVGMDTAAATNGQITTAAYAIPIDKALSIASQIESGQASTKIQIGSTGFLGVSVADSSGGGALIEGVVQNGPAAKAGIAAGDTITAIDGTSIGSATALHNALAGSRPGQQVAVTWQDGSGQTHRATVTLVTGPAS